MQSAAVDQAHAGFLKNAGFPGFLIPNSYLVSV